MFNTFVYFQGYEIFRKFIMENYYGLVTVWPFFWPTMDLAEI